MNTRTREQRMSSRVLVVWGPNRILHHTVFCLRQGSIHERRIITMDPQQRPLGNRAQCKLTKQHAVWLEGAGQTCTLRQPCKRERTWLTALKTNQHPCPCLPEAWSCLLRLTRCPEIRTDEHSYFLFLCAADWLVFIWAECQSELVHLRQFPGEDRDRRDPTKAKRSVPILIWRDPSSSPRVTHTWCQPLHSPFPCFIKELLKFTFYVAECSTCMYVCIPPMWVCMYGLHMCMYVWLACVYVYHLCAWCSYH